MSVGGASRAAVGGLEARRAMQVMFCDMCSRRVSEGQIAHEEGFRVGDLVFCLACWELPEVQQHVREHIHERGQRASRTGFHRAVGRRVQNGGRRDTPSRESVRVGRHATAGNSGTSVGVDTQARRHARPVSPVSLDPVRRHRGSGPHRTPRRLKGLQRPCQSSSQLALYGVAGVVIGFVTIALAVWLAGS